MIASIVRFQRGRAPRPVYAPHRALPPGLQHVVRVGAGLLRVAHALGRGPSSDVCEVRPGVR